MAKKADKKDKVKVQRHPLGEKLKTIQQQINKSDKFIDCCEFVNGLHKFMNGELDVSVKQHISIRDLLVAYVDHIEMFVTEKDRIIELVKTKLKVEVKTVRESGGRYTLQVVKDKKKETMYVEKKKDGYVYGIRNFEIGSL